jgi:hypothetical protein
LKQTAEAFANERVAHKPESPWAHKLAERARKLPVGKQAA